MNIKDVTVDYEEKFDHYGITHLLIYRNSILNKVLKLDAHYLELYKDDNFIIYERLNVKKENNLKQYSIYSETENLRLDKAIGTSRSGIIKKYDTKDVRRSTNISKWKKRKSIL